MIIDIPDKILGEGSVELFSRHIFEIDSIDEIFEHAAYNANNIGGGYNVDYIGLLGEKGKQYNDTPDSTFEIINEYVEFEVN
jgi:hypothetical protein